VHHCKCDCAENAPRRKLNSDAKTAPQTSIDFAVSFLNKTKKLGLKTELSQPTPKSPQLKSNYLLRCFNIHFHSHEIEKLTQIIIKKTIALVQN
jgi:hypothetical protein